MVCTSRLQRVALYPQIWLTMRAKMTRLGAVIMTGYKNVRMF